MADVDIELLDHPTHIEARYLGTYAIDLYLKQMEHSIKACEDRGLDRLLVDIRGLKGFAPTTIERHRIGVFGAQRSRNLRRVAALIAPESVRDHHASTVARNRGLAIETFTDRDRALGWLLA